MYIPEFKRRVESAVALYIDYYTDTHRNVFLVNRRKAEGKLKHIASKFIKLYSETNNVSLSDMAVYHRLFFVSELMSWLLTEGLIENHDGKSVFKNMLPFNAIAHDLAIWHYQYLREIT